MYTVSENPTLGQICDKRFSSRLLFSALNYGAKRSGFESWLELLCCALVLSIHVHK